MAANRKLGCLSIFLFVALCASVLVNFFLAATAFQRFEGGRGEVEYRPRFTEMMAWRCMIPMEKVPTRVGPGLSVELPHGEYFGWIGPNGHVICYPIGDGSVLNMFVGHVTNQWVEESWSVKSSQQELLDAHEGWNEALLDMFRNVQHVYKWGIHDRDPIPQWTKGRVTLLGDAAHPTMPTLGNLPRSPGLQIFKMILPGSKRP